MTHSEYIQSCFEEKKKRLIEQVQLQAKEIEEWEETQRKRIKKEQDQKKQNQYSNKPYSEWPEEQKEKRKKYRAKYRSRPSVRERINKQAREWDRKKRATDKSFYIAKKMRSRLSAAIKNKKLSAKMLVGCSWDELVAHLESQFKDGMSWDNKSEWHVDHIIPLSSFDLTIESEQLKAAHYTNLQPLWAEDNLSKGAKYMRNEKDNNSIRSSNYNIQNQYSTKDNNG